MHTFVCCSACVFRVVRVTRHWKHIDQYVFLLFPDAGRGTELNITADMCKLLQTFVGPFVTALADSVADV